MSEVMHLNTIAGQSVLTVIKGNEPASINMPTFVGGLVERALQSEVFYGRRWPVNAEFALTYLYHTWPMGWDKESSRVVVFFDTADEMNLRLDELREWSLSEDNEVQIDLWRWDFEPTKFDSKHFR